MFVHLPLPNIRDAKGDAQAEREKENQRFWEAMERSMSAWSQIREQHPEQVVLDRMTELARLRSLADRVFPHARDFIRPGLDD
jgi:hypothetical protein